MLGERSESTVGAENVLLAGGTGAVIASREIEEPESTSAPEGATAPTTTAGAGTTSEPLERQVSAIEAMTQAEIVFDLTEPGFLSGVVSPESCA